MDNKQPLVSVLMTTYNREKYLSAAIESVVNSNFQDWELIIVDDCSSDNTQSIVKPFLFDKRISYHRNKTNLGQFPNRNKAASLATGKYIKYLDSDDLIYKHGLEVMYRCIAEFPEAGIGICQLIPSPLKQYPILTSTRDATYEHFTGKGIYNAGPSSCIILKEAFDVVGGFRKTNYVGNDTLLFLDIGAKYPVVKMPSGLIWWRRHDEQEFTKGTTDNNYFLHDFEYQSHFLLSEDQPLENDVSKKIYKSYLKMRIGQIIKKATIHCNPVLAFRGFMASKKQLFELLKRC